MRLKIDGRIYKKPALDEVSLRDVLVFDSEVTDLNPKLQWTWADVERVSKEFDALHKAGDKDAAEIHPDRFLYLGTLIWVVRRAAGEVVTFSEAVDVRSFEWIEDPQDRKKKAAGPTKGAKAKKASAPAVSTAAAASAVESTTSESPSTAE